MSDRLALAPSQSNIVDIAIPVLELSEAEAKALERLFFREYIHYDDEELHNVCRKIMSFNRRKK